jgi:glutaredoxin
MTKVSMCTLSTCPVCWKIKKSCRATGIPFDFVDYNLASESEQNKIAAKVMKGIGNIGFLFVRIEDIVVNRFNLEMFEQLKIGEARTNKHPGLRRW